MPRRYPEEGPGSGSGGAAGQPERILLTDLLTTALYQLGRGWNLGVREQRKYLLLDQPGRVSSSS